MRQYQGLVYTVCHQLVPDVGEAQDLTQETFLAAWRSIDRCPPGFEKQWLARIASNKAKDYLRSAWVRRVNTPGDEVLALEGAPPESDPEQQVLETLGEEELTRRILALRAAGPRKPWRPRCTGPKRCWPPSCGPVGRKSRRNRKGGTRMDEKELELFREDGCLTDEGLQALRDGQLDELGRLEAAEHLSYCDKCMDRYTALLTADVLETPPRGVHGTIMTTIWVRLMQSTYGRVAVAGVAAVLALSLWRSGAITAILGRGCDLKTILPSQTMSTPPQELTGKPMETRQEFYHKLSGVLENLLPGKTPDAGAIPTTPKQSVT